ncbi:MAG: hypothetical protein ACRD0G_18075 [Acidimicrobiales bacterium]
MAYQFLSPEWIDQVRAIRDQYRDHQPALAPPALKANLVVTDVPHGNGKVLAHTDTSDGTVEIELGHLDDPDITVTLAYETAKQVVVDQKPEDIAKAWLFGKIRVDGDLTKLLPDGTDPFVALNGVDLADLRHLDPTANEISERIKAITA